MRLFSTLVSLSLTFAGFACSQSEQGTGAEAAPGSIARVLAIASVQECPNGGVELEYGVDTNLNGSLDDDEVAGSYSVCHGEAGADGQPCVSSPTDDGGYEITCPNQDPIAIEAGCFGFAKRARLYYGLGPLGNVAEVSEKELPPFFTFGTRHMGDQRAQVKAVVWQGKPMPADLVLEGGFKLHFDPKKVAEKEGSGGFAPFTRDFPHKGLSQRKASAGARQRAREDSQAFADTAYEAESLLWRGDEWRTLNSRERAQIQMLPTSSITALGTSKDAVAKRRIQNSAVGNGFHLPSLAVFLILLSNLAPPASSVKTLLAQDEMALRCRIQGTAFDHSIVDSFPGRLTADCIIKL